MLKKLRVHESSFSKYAIGVSLLEPEVKHNNFKPILLKIAPDLTMEQIVDVIDLALEINLDGLVVSNTTIGRDAVVTTEAEIKKTYRKLALVRKL